MLLANSHLWCDRLRRRAKAAHWTSGPAVFVAIAMATLVGVAATAAGAAPTPSPGSPFERRVSAVRIQPAWLVHDDDPVLLKPGDTLTDTNLSAALNAVKNAISARGERYGRALGTSLLTLTYVEPEFALGDHDDVAVTLRPFYLALPVGAMGRLALPFPRELPRGDRRNGPNMLPLELGVSSDRTIGLSADAALALNFGGNTKRPAPYTFRLSGQQSLENSYHSGHAAFRSALTRSSGLTRSIYAAAEASTALQPLAENRDRRNSAGIRTGMTLAPWRSSRLLLDLSLRRTDERFEDRAASMANPPAGAGRHTEDSPDELASRVLFEAIPPTMLGFFRAALWHDVQRSNGASTQRLSGRVGYAREWLLRPNQSIGFEVVAGLGELWGVSPERRRFFGGTAGGSFLYDAPDANSLLKAPNGPLLRSFGRAQAGLLEPSGTTRGGTRFRHASLSVSLPIPAWSRPLIPDEPVGIPGTNGRELTLKDMLRNQVDRSGPNLLASSLAALEQLDPPEAQRRAREVFGEIQPAAHYIIDRANVFALKPLLLLDVATLESATQSESWTAAGAGVQLTVVTAQLDVGYMRTVSGAARSKDNLFLRLAFERLF